jgi:chromosome segregation ATPase
MELENQLNNLAKQMKDIRQQNEFNEIDLKQFKDKLNKLKDELDKPSNLLINPLSPIVAKMLHLFYDYFLKNSL